MAKPSSTSKVAELLGVIKKTPDRLATLSAEATPPAPTTRKPARKPQADQPGKASLIYFHPEDKQIIRELSAWFAGQGLRINDSLVIKSVLRAARPGTDLLTTYHNAIQSDRRFKKPKTKE